MSVMDGLAAVRRIRELLRPFGSIDPAVRRDLEDPQASPETRRKQPRARTVAACRLTHGIHGECHEGVVRDIHGCGARIRPKGSPAVIGERVQFEFGDQKRPARVIWRSDRELGIAFLNGSG